MDSDGVVVSLRMIIDEQGDLFASPAEALVNTVNTIGVMGKGIALVFKTAFPHNFRVYAAACKSKSLIPGKLLAVRDTSLLYGEKLVINFPTKTDWRLPSEYAYVEQGLEALAELIQKENIASIAIPALGCGNGGLDWVKVKDMIHTKLHGLQTTIHLYGPQLSLIEKKKIGQPSQRL